jgi:hypothetical protein
MVGLVKEALKRHNIPYDEPEYDLRVDLLVDALRGKPGWEARLKTFASQKGGADFSDIPIQLKPDNTDFLGPRLRWLVEAMGSPYAQGVVRVLFTVLFFTSYLESIPLFGSILGAVLDIMVSGGKALIKAVQKMIPVMFGIIPLPFMSFIGIGMAAVFGLLVWPLIGILSFTRQDFAAAIESFIRVIPPPIGDTLADVFMEANRAVARIDQKRAKISEDIAKGIEMISNLTSGMTGKIKEGATSLASATRAAGTGLQQKIAATGGERLSRKKKRKNKWKKTMRQSKYVMP